MSKNMEVSEGKEETGKKIVPISEVEFNVPEVPRLTAFFTDAFGVTVTTIPDFPEMPQLNFGVKLTAIARKRTENDVQTTVLYVTITEMDNEIARLKAIGAQLIHGPVPFPGFGQYAYIQVPGALIFGLWESENLQKDNAEPVAPKKKPGDDGTLSFFELLANDCQAFVDFSRAAWNWDFGTCPEIPGHYWYFMGDQERTFSIGLRSPCPGNDDSDLKEAPGVIAYINVSSLEDAKKNQLVAGGRVRQERRKYSKFGFAALCEGPGDVVFGLWENIPHTKIDKETKCQTEEAEKVVAAAQEPEDAEETEEAEEPEEVEEPEEAEEEEAKQKEGEEPPRKRTRV